MAVTSYTLTANFPDLLGVAFDPTAQPVQAWIETNLPKGQALVDTANNRILLGGAKFTADQFGVVVFDGLVGSDSTPSDINLAEGTLQYRVHASYIDAATSTRERWASGWFSLTADNDLSDVVAEQFFPAEALTTATEALAAIVAQGQAILEAQVDISGIDTSDAVVEALIRNTSGAGPLTIAALGERSTADRARGNHTGTQTASTISDFAAAADARVNAAPATGTGDLVRKQSPQIITPTGITNGDVGLGNVDNIATGTTSGTIPVLGTGGRLAIARLASGTPDGSKFVRDDGTLATPAGGGGGLLASTQYNPTSATFVNTSGGAGVFSDVDATNLSVTFTVPASGAVVVSLTALSTVSATSSLVMWGVGVAGTLLPASASILHNGAGGRLKTTHRFKLTGLTPGASIAYRWMHATSGGNGANITYGGTGTTAYGPALMEVLSA